MVDKARSDGMGIRIEVDDEVGTAVAGATYGGLLIGALGFVVTVAALLQGAYTAAAVGVLGSGVAFGLLANAFLRE